MKKIDEITDDVKQNHSLTLEDGSVISITFEYKSNISGWFMSFSYGSREFNNRRIVVSPNMLRQFRNLIPFGFACTSLDGQEPIFQDDFSGGRCDFFLLNADDVDYFEENIFSE